MLSVTKKQGLYKMTDYFSILLNAFVVLGVHLYFKYRKVGFSEDFEYNLAGGSVGVFSGWIIIQLLDGLTLVDVITNIIKSVIIV